MVSSKSWLWGIPAMYSSDLIGDSLTFHSQLMEYCCSRLCPLVLIWKFCVLRLLSTAINFSCHKDKLAKTSTCLTNLKIKKMGRWKRGCDINLNLDWWSLFFETRWRETLLLLLYCDCFFLFQSCHSPLSYIKRAPTGLIMDNSNSPSSRATSSCKTNSLAHSCHYCKSVWQSQRWGTEYNHVLVAAACMHSGVNRLCSC